MVQIERDGRPVVCVVGLGYVGFPLADAFSKHLHVIGYDISERRLNQLTEECAHSKVILTSDPSMIREADVVIICVPTPVTRSKEPDLCPLISAAETVGANMKEGCTVVIESTVYPGVTEEIIAPVLEKQSGMTCGVGFKVGYSPERINPGDDAHSIDKITKIVSGMDRECTDTLVSLYGLITNPYRAPNLKTAEAAKVIENVQRDLNIALMNELALIFERIGIDTEEVLNAASTKWNFVKYSPGMVGGHCIPVDPYYLVYKAKELGYHAQVILAGRAINDSMPKHVAESTIKGLNEVDKIIKGSKVLIMGLTYKENVPDVRESPVRGVIRELQEFKVKIYGLDPMLDEASIRAFGIEPWDAGAVDAIIVGVAHDHFKEITPQTLVEMCSGKPVIVDIKRVFTDLQDRNDVHYWTL